MRPVTTGGGRDSITPAPDALEVIMSESKKTNRRANGTFAKGSTGNPKGRPPKDRRIPSPDHMRDMFYDVAEFEMPAQINGKVVRLNLLQSNLLTLALAGAKGDTQCALKFTNAIQQVSEQERREMDRLIKRLDGVTPAYKFESDPVVRARKQKAWHAAVAEATGDRDKTTYGLGRLRRRRRD